MLDDEAERIEDELDRQSLIDSESADPSQRIPLEEVLRELGRESGG